jgi:hypothetical protein
LIVSRDEADPASLIEGLAGAAAGFGAGSGLGAAGFGAATRETAFGATWGLDFFVFTGARFVTLTAGLRAGFATFWTRDAFAV